MVIGVEDSSRADQLAVKLEPGLDTKGDEYVFVRRMILHKLALDGKLRRQSWECNGADYNTYRKYIRSLKENYDPSLSDRFQWAGVLNTPSKASYASSNHRLSMSSMASEAEHLRPAQQPAYAFTGMKCILDTCKTSVNVVRFGHLSSNLLAFGSTDGTLCICSLEGSSPVVNILKGHSKEITDFDWSLNNHYLCSSSLDKTVRVWDVKDGHCVRIIYDNTAQLSIRFHTLNNNYLVIATANKFLKVINFSTGRCVHKLNVGVNITAMDMDSSGRLLFAGDSYGCIHSIAVDATAGKLSSAHTNNKGLKRKTPTTTVQFRAYSRLAGGPVLLASNQDGSLRFFSVALEVNGYLTMRCSLQLPPHARNTRASFCPLLSLEKGEIIVSGSEDRNVYFYDFTRGKHPVNKLQGHGAPIVGVSWNFGENLLASSDCEGVVIVWQRA